MAKIKENEINKNRKERSYWKRVLKSGKSSRTSPPLPAASVKIISNRVIFQSELDIADTTQQRLSISDAAYFLQRFTELADVFIFVSGINFSELEQEK